MPYSKFPLLDKKNLKTNPISQRHSLVDSRDFAKPVAPGTISTRSCSRFRLFWPARTC